MVDEGVQQHVAEGPHENGGPKHRRRNSIKRPAPDPPALEQLPRNRTQDRNWYGAGQCVCPSDPIDEGDQSLDAALRITGG